MKALDTKHNSIEFFRFLFALQIAVYHTWDYFEAPVFGGGGYIAVDFFFILSGFFMYRHICIGNKEGVKLCPSKDTAAYMISRIKRIYLDYLLAFLSQFLLLNCIVEKNCLKQTILNLLNSCWTLLLINEAGIGPIIYNGAAGWYLSALLIASYLVYYLAVKFPDTFIRYLAPIEMIGIYSFFYNRFGHLEIATEFCNTGGTLRAIAGISLGCICYHIFVFIDNFEYTKMGKFLFDFIELSLIIMIMWCEKRGFTQNDFICVLLFGLLIPLLYSQESHFTKLFQRPIFGFLGKISFLFFLNHRFILILFIQYIPGLTYVQMLPIYLLGTFIFSVGMYILSDKIRSRMISVCEKIKKTLCLEA